MSSPVKPIILLSIILFIGSCAGSLGKKHQTQHEVGIAYLNLETGEMLAYNAHTLFHAASTMKTPVMFQLYRMRDQRVIKLTDNVRVNNSFTSIVDGSLYSLPIQSVDDEILYPFLNTNMSYFDLIDKMITHSSNLATNILMEYTTPDSNASTLKKIGANGVMVLRGVEDLKAYNLGLNNVTSAFGMMKVMEAVYRSDLVADSSRQEMIDILSRQVYNSMIPAGLPAGTRVAHKTGSITKIAHDAAIVYPQDASPFVLVILTRGWDKHAEASRVGARIASKVYDYHLGKLSRTDIIVPDLLK
jgi:beta-lactamase class A